MPASIAASLLLWSTLLTPGAGPSTVPMVGVGPIMTRMIAVEAFATIRTWPLPGEGSWAISEADLEEEESGDGDPDGISSDADWALSPPHLSGQASAIRPDRGLATSPIRSPILRC